MEQEALVDARASEAARHLLLLRGVCRLQRRVHGVIYTVDLLPARSAAAGDLSLGVAKVPLLRGLHSSTSQLNLSGL